MDGPWDKIMPFFGAMNKKQRVVFRTMGQNNAFSGAMNNPKGFVFGP